MPDVTGFNVDAVGIANCAVTIALIERLIEKGLLDLTDAVAILEHAAGRVASRATTVESAAEALQVIKGVLLRRFAASMCG